MDVYFDMYRKNSLFRNRTPVIFDEQKVFIPTKQLEIFKVLIKEDREIKQAVEKDGFICLTGLREDIQVRLILNGDNFVFTLNRSPVTSLGIIDLHLR